MSGSLCSLPLKIYAIIHHVLLHKCPGRGLRWLVVIIFIAALTGCFKLQRPFIPQPSDLVSIENLFSMMRNQDQSVSSFSATGTVHMEGWIWGSSAEILLAGTKEPFRLKIEITHSWGKPVIHVLIRDDRLEILDFKEKKLYTGEFSSGSLSRFLPAGDYDRDAIWSILRGFPELLPFHDIQTPEASRVNLLDRHGDVIEEIDYYPERSVLRFVSFPGQSQNISFSGFSESNGTHYAAEVKLEDVREGKRLTLRKKRMAFNRDLPDQLFLIEKPSAFETVLLDE